MMFCGKYSKGSLAMSVGRLLSAVVAAAMLLAACSEKGLDTENAPRKFKTEPMPLEAGRSFFFILPG